VPMAGDANWQKVTLPPVERTVDELRQTLAQIEEKMNGLAPTFFAGEAGDRAARAELAHLLSQILPDPLLPQYRALAPDFFAWLDA